MMVPPPARREDYDDDNNGNKNDDDLSRDRRRAEGGEGETKTALMMNTLTSVSGVRVRWILGMGDGGDCGVMMTTTMTSRRADRIPPPRRQR